MDIVPRGEEKGGRKEKRKVGDKSNREREIKRHIITQSLSHRHTLDASLKPPRISSSRNTQHVSLTDHLKVITGP